MKLFYRKRKRAYKYVVSTDFEIQTDIRPDRQIQTSFIFLAMNGRMIIYKDYAWDGATSITDQPSVMRASLVHDALYQLMREEYLDHRQWKKPADLEFTRLCREDGLCALSAWKNFKGLEWFGTYSCLPQVEENTEHTAP